jgi:hypothetical protein
VEFPIYTEVTASTSVGETATPTSHQMDLSMASLTLAKRSVYVGLGDLAKKSMTDPQSIGEAMGMSMVKAIDTSIFAVVTTTNYATSAGSTDQTMTLTYVLNGINLLEVNEVELPVNVVMLPVQFKGIRLGLTPVANDDTVTGALSDVIGSQGVLSRAFGANWYASPRVGTRTVDATASCNSGLIFAQKAIGFGFSWLYTAGVESIRSDEALDKLLLTGLTVPALSIQVVFAHYILREIKMAEAKKEVSKPKPKTLTEDEKAKIVEEYLGVHPKYFVYAGQTIRVNIWPMEKDGVFWNGWRIDEMEKNTWSGN